jgi:hypothetical protein
MEMTPAELSESPVYKSLLKEEGDPEKAKERLAERARLIAFGVSASISGAASKLTSGVESRLFTGTVKKAGGPVAFALGLTGTALREAGEETLQEGGEPLAGNVGKRLSGAKPDQDIREGVAGQAGVGFALGAATGGLVSASGEAVATVKARKQGGRATPQEAAREYAESSLAADEVEAAQAEQEGQQRGGEPRAIKGARQQAEDEDQATDRGESDVEFLHVSAPRRSCCSPWGRRMATKVACRVPGATSQAPPPWRRLRRSDPACRWCRK